MQRARVVTLNAALGPLDYRVPDGMEVEPGSIVVAPLGPAPAARRRVGAGAAADRGSRRQPPAPARRRARRAADRRAASPPVRMDRRLLSRPLASVLRMVLPSSAALDGPRQLTEYRPTGARPRPPDAAAREGARRASRAGRARSASSPTMPRSATRVMRGLVNAGALEAVAVDADRPLACPDPDHRAARPQRRPARGGREPGSASIGKGFDPVLLDGVTGSGKTEVYFEAIAECLRQGRQALVLLPEIALTEPFLKRFEARFGCAAGRLAFGPALVAAAPRLARNRQRRGQGHGRRALGPVPALPEPRPDRRRRGARAELQAGGRGPVSRPRHRGDARPSSRTFRSSSRPRRRRSRAGTWSSSAAIAKSACPSASPARRLPDITRDRPDPGPAAARPLAGADAGRGARGQPRARRAVAAVPQPPRLRAADPVPPLRPPLPMPQLHRVDGRAPADAPPRLPPLRPCHAAAQGLPRMRRGGQPGRLRARRRADRRRGRRAVPRCAHRDRHLRHHLVAAARGRVRRRDGGAARSTSSSAPSW